MTLKLVLIDFGLLGELPVLSVFLSPFFFRGRLCGVVPDHGLRLRGAMWQKFVMLVWRSGKSFFVSKSGLRALEQRWDKTESYS